VVECWVGIWLGTPLGMFGDGTVVVSDLNERRRGWMCLLDEVFEAEGDCFALLGCGLRHFEGVVFD
jgi:hypothetical protein